MAICFREAQMAFEDVFTESIGILNKKRDETNEKLVYIKSRITLIQAWCKDNREKTIQELDEQQNDLELVNNAEACLIDEERQLTEMMENLNTQKNELMSDHSNLQSKLDALNHRLDELDEQMRDLDNDERSARAYASELFNDALNQNFWPFITMQYSGFSNFSHLVGFIGAKLQKPGIENEKKNIHELIERINTLINDSKRKNEEICEVKSKQGKLLESRSKILAIITVKREKLDLCKTNINDLIKIEKELDEMMEKISLLDQNSEVRKESTLKTQLNSLISQVLEAQKMFLKLQKDY